MVAGHGCRGGPSKVIVEHLPQRIVAGEAHVGESLVEACNGAAIHLLVLAVAAVRPDDGGFVAIGTGVGGRASECLGPVGGEALDMILAETMAEGVGDDFVGHYAHVPGVGKAAHAVHATGGFEEGLHVAMMTVVLR